MATLGRDCTSCALLGIAILILSALVLGTHTALYGSRSAGNQRKDRSGDSGSMLVLKKDYELNNLITLLDRIRGDFDTWPSVLEQTKSQSSSNIRSHASKFMFSIIPWMIAEPAVPLNISSNPEPFSDTLNCSNPKYGRLFSGQKLTQPRVIVDFIPFGYDIDKLGWFP